MLPVVVTGVGVICSVARNDREFLDAIRKARLGIAEIERLDIGWLPCRLAGEVKQLDPLEELGHDGLDLSRADAFAVVAARQALDDAAVDLTTIGPSRVGVSVGTCQGRITDLVPLIMGGETVGAEEPSGSRLISSADAVATAVGARGPRFVVTNACAAGGAAIAVAMEKLVQGEIDVALAGGTDELAFFTMAGFTVLQSLDPEPCSPYSRSAGLNVGEGAAMFVLERADDVRRRGASPRVRLLGYGLSADGHHPTAPDPTGRGASLAMRRALASSGLSPDDIDYVSGHGTGTASNDAMEPRALRKVFGDRAPQVPMSSSKSMVGHLLGAAAAIEAAACVLAIEADVLPPTINVPDGAVVEFDCVPNAARTAPVRFAMSNNYAFGGSNASLVLGEVEAPDRASTNRSDAPRRVVVSGIGCVGAPGIGVEAWWERLRRGEASFRQLDFGLEPGDPVIGAPSPPLPGNQFAPKAMWRKMDPLGRLCVASSRLAWDDAGLDLSVDDRDQVGVVLATACGSVEATIRLETDARRGKGHANAGDFPHTSMNAAAGHVCTALGIHGPMLSISNPGGLASPAALSFASDLIRSGQADRVLVVAGDELSKALVQLARGQGMRLAAAPRPFEPSADGTCPGAAAVTLVLERLEAAVDRQATIYGELLGTSLVGADSDAVTDASTWALAFEGLLDRAQVPAASVGYCAAAASGICEDDAAELTALAKVFGPDLPVGAPKSIVGECLSSSGAVGVVAALLALTTGALTPTAGATGLANRTGPVVTHIDRETTGPPPDYAIANALGTGSGVSCTLLGRFEAGA